ncbi:hypothetical protein HDU91_003514, partial [Kappamyces sp. JEL0680]
IKGIRLISDPDTGKPKGFGYVEFMDRESLVSAIGMSGESLHKRSIRINYAERTATPATSFSRNDRDHDRPHTGGWASGFRRNDGKRLRLTVQMLVGHGRFILGPFQKREDTGFPKKDEAASTEPPKPKPNPFGNALPRDEMAIQKQIEERRAAREAEANAEKAER